MAHGSQAERRKLQTFRDKIVPTVFAAVIVSALSSVVLIRDTVNQHADNLKPVNIQGSDLSLRDALIKHERDIIHFKERCHRIESDTRGLDVLTNTLKGMNERLKECRADIDRLEHR